MASLQEEERDNYFPDRCLFHADLLERYNTIAKRLPLWKKDEGTAYLKDAPSQTLQQTLKDLDRAVSDFFKKQKKAPKFKKKGESDSFRYPQGFNIKEKCPYGSVA